MALQIFLSRCPAGERDTFSPPGVVAPKRAKLNAQVGPAVESRPNRRAVLAGLGCASAASFVAGRVFGEAPIEPLRAFLALHFTHPDTVAWLGEAYLSAESGERDRTALEWAVFGDVIQAPSNAMTQAVAERIAADFRAADMVAVRGWGLARTEARLCALAALVDLA